MRKLICIMIITLLLLCSCGKSGTDSDTSAGDYTISKADTSGMDFSVSDSGEIDANGTPIDLSTAKFDSSLSGISAYAVTRAGTYTLTGTKNDAMIIVDADKAEVNLVLSGAEINNSKGPAIYVRSAKKVTLSAAKGTTSTLSDGSSYSVTDSYSTLDAAVFSKADITLNGGGTLILNGNYKHGIVSKDDLIISSGTVKVTSKNVGICGKDCVKIDSGSITVNADSDGIRSDNEEDSSKGYIYLNGGTLNITAGNDGVQAATVLKADNVNLTLNTGKGSANSLSSASESYKGLKAGSDIYLSGGSFNIDSTDDCIHSNGTITVSGGTYTLSSGDDGIHADTDLEISENATKISITKSYEGIEATNINIKGGTVSVVASDDGLNAAGGDNSSGDAQMRPGKGLFSSSTGTLNISGGDIYIEMGGDGIDANGSMSITGGTITVNGAISGGTFIGTGASGMAQNFSTDSTQGVIMVMTGTQSAGSTVKLTDSSNKELLTYTAKRDFSCVIISSSDIESGKTYTLTAGSSTTSITMDGTVYGSGNSGGMGGPVGMGGGGMGGRR